MELSLALIRIALLIWSTTFLITGPQDMKAPAGVFEIVTWSLGYIISIEQPAWLLMLKISARIGKRKKKNLLFIRSFRNAKVLF